MATARTTKSSKSDVSLDDLADQIDTLRAELSALSDNVGTYGKTRSRRAADEARETAHSAAALGEERLRAAQDSLARLPDDAATAVRDRPMATLAIAAGVGLLFGMMSGRR